MKERNKIMNMRDLRAETARIRKTIGGMEQELSGDVRQVVESITPTRIITGIAGKLMASAPAIYTAWTFFRSIFGRKK
jgi:hypothetical protein